MYVLALVSDISHPFYREEHCHSERLSNLPRNQWCVGAGSKQPVESQMSNVQEICELIIEHSHYLKLNFINL